MAMVICRKCGKEFYAKPFWIKKGWGKYCSSECHHASMRNGKEMACAVCGEMAYKTQKSIERSKSGLFFCSKSCQTKWRNQLFTGDKHTNYTTGLYSYRSVLNRNKIPKICVLCQNADTRVLAVHHIDKNRKNNTVENLAWLCNNCHFLVHHYEEAREKFMAAIV